MARKKRITLFTIVSFILLFIGMGVGAIFAFLPSFAPAFSYGGKTGFLAVLKSVPHFLKLALQPKSGSLLATLVFLAAVVFFVVFALILLFRADYKKNLKAHGVLFAIIWLIYGAIASLIVMAVFTTGFLQDLNGVAYAGRVPGISFLINLARQKAVNIALVVLGFVPFLLFLISFIFVFIAYFKKLSLLRRADKGADESAEQEGSEKEEGSEGANAQDGEAGKKNQKGKQGKDQAEDANDYRQGPFVVQYINTQTGESKVAEKNDGKSDSVSIDEVKAAINDQKQMTVEDVRRIIQEEFARERMNANEKPAQVAPKEEQKVVPEKANEPLSQGDIQSVIRDELLMFQQAQVEADAARKAEEEKRMKEEVSRRERAEKEAKTREEEYRRQAEETARLKAEKEAAEEALRQLQAQEAARQSSKPALTSEEIKQLIAEALAQKEGKPAANSESLKSDDIRAIIRDELANMRPVQTAEVVVAPMAQPEVVEPKPEPQKRVVGAINPDLPPHEKIIRIPFPNRMVDADDLMKSNYNELKSELMAYGLKSRVSNSGDTFRLHKVTYVKIAIAGKSLKLYMALDPKEYADSTLPIADVGAKNTYKDIPFVFKVKSPLSMRRAKQLIADLMDKHDLEQAKVNPYNWADELKDYKPTGSKEDDD